MSKILQICAYAAPYPGNFIKSMQALADEALNNGVGTIFCFPEICREISWCKDLEKEYKIYYLPLARARILPGTYIKLRHIFKENPDILYAHSHFELYDTPLALTAPKHIKVYWHLHDAIGTYLHGWRKFLWKMHYGWFSKRATLLSVSQKHMQVAISLGFKLENAYYEPNAIDTERVEKIRENRETECDFLIFGWDYYRKGVDLAEKAISEVKQNTILGVIGKNCLHHDSQSNFVIKELQPSSDINKVFSSTKCFLHISRAEGLSYALLEALYSGLPVIVSDIEENLIAKEFPTAIMVRNENIHQIADAMRKIHSGEISFSESDINQTRKIIETKYSIHTWTKRVFERISSNSNA